MCRNETLTYEDSWAYVCLDTPLQTSIRCYRYCLFMLNSICVFELVIIDYTRFVDANMLYFFSILHKIFVKYVICYPSCVSV